MEVMELIWQDIGVWNEIKCLPAKSFLHLDIVVAETILARYLVALREVVDPLVLVKALVHVTLARRCRPT